LFSEKLFSNLSLIYSDYYYGLDLDFVGFKWDSGIITISSTILNYISDKFKLNYGVNGIYYEFNPGTSNHLMKIPVSTLINWIKIYAFESALYINADHDISNKIALSDYDIVCFTA
jgi:hypothetical protein